MKSPYSVRRELRPHGLEGISEDQIAQHWALYEGYVKNVNLLDERIDALSRDGAYGPEFAELKRREGFEYNGMLLHERYFGILQAGRPALATDSALAKKLAEDFPGGSDGWRNQFAAIGHMRGTGWVILYLDPRQGRLSNVWISSHEEGHPAGFVPLLVMDVWEHAYMVDSGADGRPAYIVKFLKNVDWAAVDAAYRAAGAP